MKERSGLNPFGGNLSLAERLWQEPTDFPQSSMGRYLAIMLFIRGLLGNGQVRRKSFEGCTLDCTMPNFDLDWPRGILTYIVSYYFDVVIVELMYSLCNIKYDNFTGY